MNWWDWLMGADFMATRNCLHNDWWVIGNLIVARSLVAVSYVLIAWNWFTARRRAPNTPAKRVLSNLILVFLLCGLCGYLLPSLMIFVPAWRLLCFVLWALVIVSFIYVFTVMNFNVVFSEMARGSAVKQDIKELLHETPDNSEARAIKQRIMDRLDRVHDTLDLLSR